MTDTDLLGQPIESIPTPALVVDLDLLEQNLRHMAAYFAERPCKLRPHFKSHKCVELARRQLAAGACTGITCAKLAEAEQLAAGGIHDILIANQVVGADKARRLAALNRHATVRCAVDSLANARELSGVATDAGIRIPVLIEVDIGMKRCGVPPGTPTLELARVLERVHGTAHGGLAVQGREPARLVGADHLVGDEDVLNAASGELFGLGELGAGDAGAGAGRDLTAGELDAFVGLEMGPQLAGAVGKIRRHASEILFQ